MCKWYNCTAPSSGDYCVQHAKMIGGKSEKKKEPYTIPKQSEKKKKQIKEHKTEKDSLSLFFAKMASIAPKNCMECGCSLKPSMLINPRSIICHILPKRHFKSIAKNEKCIVFLCIDCHSRMDNFSPAGMKILPILVERVKMLLDEIKHEELKHLPEFLNIK